jgi:hypothetical protein
MRYAAIPIPSGEGPGVGKSGIRPGEKGKGVKETI